MTEKALISELTWRSLEMQKEHFPDMPYFIAPDDIHQLLRATTRKTEDKIFVVSFGVIADNEKDLREFAKLCKARKTEVCSAEGQTVWRWYNSVNVLVEWWRNARRNGSSKIGARKSADNKKALAKAAAEKIADRWPMSSDEWPTDKLLKEAGISLNTVKVYLGKRPIAQHNYRTKHGRQIKQLELNPEPREKMDFCGVYIFQIDEGVYKVGSSNHSGRRFQQVSQHHKKQMKVIETFNMDIDKAFKVEAEAHYLLRKFLDPEYRGREIFKASLNTIKKAINKAVKNVTEAPKYE